MSAVWSSSYYYELDICLELFFGRVHLILPDIDSRSSPYTGKAKPSESCDRLSKDMNNVDIFFRCERSLARFWSRQSKMYKNVPKVRKLPKAKHLCSSEWQPSYLVGAFQPVSVCIHECKEEIGFRDQLCSSTHAYPATIYPQQDGTKM